MSDLQRQLQGYFDAVVDRTDAPEAIRRSTAPATAPPGAWLAGRPLLAMTASAVAVLVVGGLAFGLSRWLGLGGEGAAPSEPAVAVVGADALAWDPMEHPPRLDRLDLLVGGCCWNLALGGGEWGAGWGSSFDRGYPGETLPSELGPIRSIAHNGNLEMIAVLDRLPSPEPQVAAIQGPPSFETREMVALPADLPSPHPSLVLHYDVLDVAFTDRGSEYAVIGMAIPEVDPAAIEAIHPDLAPVVGTDLMAPCCDDGPLSTDIPDPLWVWTGDAGSQPIAISLSDLALTPEDLRGPLRGIVWMFRWPETPAPFAAVTVLDFAAAGREMHLASGKPDGFAVTVPNGTGGTDTWIAPTGEAWSQAGSLDAAVIDLSVWGEMPVAVTEDGGVLALGADGSWGPFVDAEVLGSPEESAVQIAAGDLGVVVVVEGEAVLPGSEGEGVPVATELWFSADGRAWNSHSLTDVVGGTGAVQVLVTRQEGHQETHPVVLLAFGRDQANRHRIEGPEWWVGSLRNP